jgi:hypothetical protein
VSTRVGEPLPRPSTPRILAQIEQDQRHQAATHAALVQRRASATEPARSGGTARLLHEPLQLLLGTGLTTHRSDHTISLEPGAKVVFYTDGLIERRDEPLDDSMRTLLEELTDQHLLSAEQLCDHLLGRHMAWATDDIVITVLHAGNYQPSSRPMPTTQSL